MKRYIILFLSIGILSMAKAETIVIDDDGGYEVNEIQYPRITLDSQNRPHIVYHRGYALKYATIRNGIPHKEVVEEKADEGGRYSIAVNSSDNPCMAYTMDKGERLIYAFYDGSQWVKDTVDKVGYADLKGYGIVLRMNGNTPCIVAYSSGSPDHYLVMYKKDGDTWIADSLDIKLFRPGLGSAGTNYLDMVIQEGIPRIFYLRRDTTEYGSGIPGIFTRRWNNSWGQEEKISSDSVRYKNIQADISKDGTIGIASYSYGDKYYNSYIYHNNGSWIEEIYRENDDYDYTMYSPVLTYDTLNIPHIFGEHENTIWHYYKTQSSWEREAIVIKEHLLWHVDCEIDNKNTYHLVFHRGGTGHADTLYYTTSSVSGIEYKDSKEVETITIIRKGESIVLSMSTSVNTELEIVDITGRIRGKLIVKNGTGEWKPESKGVYFLTSKNSKIPPVKVVVW